MGKNKNMQKKAAANKRVPTTQQTQIATSTTVGMLQAATDAANQNSTDANKGTFMIGTGS